jgi:hypothetical protein
VRRRRSRRRRDDENDVEDFQSIHPSIKQLIGDKNKERKEYASFHRHILKKNKK